MHKERLELTYRKWMIIVVRSQEEMQLMRNNNAQVLMITDTDRHHLWCDWAGNHLFRLISALVLQFIAMVHVPHFVVHGTGSVRRRHAVAFTGVLKSKHVLLVLETPATSSPVHDWYLEAVKMVYICCEFNIANLIFLTFLKWIT